MTHAEFVAAFRAKQITVRGNTSLAMQVMERPLLPMYHRVAYFLWTWVWFLMFPGALVLGIWYSWWAGLVCFMLAGPVKAGFKESACQSILDHALENEAFYDAMMKVNMFHIQPVQRVSSAA